MRRPWVIHCGVGFLLVACASLAAEPTPTRGGVVNPVMEAGLDKTVSIEILELTGTQTGLAYENRLTLTDEAQVTAMVSTLDVELPLMPSARCIERYRLRFHLADGRTEEFAYSCEDGRAFMGGSQAFWSFQQVAPPERFQRLIESLVGP